MIKDKDNFMCDKMYSSICSINLAGKKNCDCCDCFYNKCDNCSYENTGMCIKCKFQKNEEEVKQMTIDEAIKHCHEVASGALCKGTVNHKACGEEHKQLGIWLEEYKIFKEKATPEVPNFEGDGIDNNGNIIFDTWICPNCDRKYEIDYEEHDYCPFCGKAILWDYPKEDIPEEE